MQRSVAYYQDATGKMKKQIQNAKRAGAKAGPAAADDAGGVEGVSETMIKHVQRVTSQIEGRQVSREEVVAMILRQRSMCEAKPTGDNAARSNEHPP